MRKFWSICSLVLGLLVFALPSFADFGYYTLVYNTDGGGGVPVLIGALVSSECPTMDDVSLAVGSNPSAQMYLVYPEITDAYGNLALDLNNPVDAGIIVDPDTGIPNGM